MRSSEAGSKRRRAPPGSGLGFSGPGARDQRDQRGSARRKRGSETGGSAAARQKMKNLADGYLGSHGESRKKQKHHGQAASQAPLGECKASNPPVSPRDGKELWAKVRAKPVTLSQRLRHAENAIKALQARLRDNDLPDDVDGSDPLPPDEETLKLKAKVADLEAKAQLSENRARAAAEFEKQARDAMAELEKLRSGFFSKSKELELSAQAGALARKQLQDARIKLEQMEVKRLEEAGAIKQANDALELARARQEQLQQQLEEARAQLAAGQVERDRIAKESEEHRIALERLKQESNDVRSSQSHDQSRLAELEKQIVESENRLVEQKGRLDAADAELKRKTETVAELRSALEDHRKIVAKLEQASMELDDLRTALKMSKDEGAAARAAIAGIREDAERATAAQAEAARVAEEELRRSHQAALKESESRVDALRAEMEALLFKAKESAAESQDTLQQRVAELTAERDAARDATKSLESCGAELRRAIATETTRREAAENDVAALKQKLEEADARASLVGQAHDSDVARREAQLAKEWEGRANDLNDEWTQRLAREIEDRETLHASQLAESVKKALDKQDKLHRDIVADIRSRMADVERKCANAEADAQAKEALLRETRTRLQAERELV